MKRIDRLTHSEEIKRVRQEGHSYAHPSIVLGFIPNKLEQNRTAVIAGRSVGGAVQRNLAKRRIRSAFQGLQGRIVQGYDLVLIARKPILTQPYEELVGSIRSLLDKAGLMKDEVR
ncbi:MAG: ribonuclease P protein component [Chloroflexota bacterium]|nr:ribonuclease P protein component [Chloroflexota bacterium]